MVAIYFALTVLLIIGPTQICYAGPVNVGTLASQANQDADLTLTNVPRNITNPDDQITIRWRPGVRGQLRYAMAYSGEEPRDYPNVLREPVRADTGFVTLRGNQLPVGYLYCIIDGGNAGYSVIFNIIRAAGSAPQMTAPISGQGRVGINTVTPVFRWEPVAGVPFYHIIVSDQPFRLEQDDQGQTRVQGANLIWQAITSETSIQYGIPDPSDNFDNSLIPPLVGSMNRDNRPRYAWIVLNNYGNSPEYTSIITGGVSGFEVEVQPPFDEPENIAPQARARLASREILFRWTQVPEAVSYFIYVSREEVTQGGSRALVPAWSGQTTMTSIACPAADIFIEGHYVWKVLAASRQGRGTLSDTASFDYIVRAGRVSFTSQDVNRAVLQFVEINVEPIDGPAVPAFATNDMGTYTRQIPVGAYRFRGSKNGYTDTLSNRLTVLADSNYSVTLRLRPIPSSIVGTVVNDAGQSIAAAIVTAVRVPGDETTTCETNVAGEYQLIVPPGNYFLTASARGHRPSAEIGVTVQPQSNFDVDAHNGPFQLTPYRWTISGYVRNPAGQPINLATVIITADDGSILRAFTPEAGSYSFSVGQGRWRLNAVKPGFYLEAGESVVEVIDRNVEMNFTLVPQAGILSGELSIDGNPANRVGEVWFIPRAGAVVTAPVNQFGAWTRGVAPGDYVVTAVRQGYTARDSISISIDPGETISGISLRLEANPASISGRIIDAGGNTLRDALVSAGGVTNRSDANGNYRLQVAVGNHTVAAAKEGYITAQRGPVSVEAGQNINNIDLTLVNNAGRISGRVQRGNDPIFDAVITAVRQEDNSRAITRTDRDGQYAFSLMFGTYRVTAQKDGFVPAPPGTYDINLQSGQNVSGRDFPMLSYIGRVSGRVSSPAGPVNTPAIQLIQLDDPNRVYSTNGNVQGEFLLAVTPERRYIVVASKVGYSTARDTSARLNIEGEIVVALNLVQLPCQVSGLVAVRGAPLGGATVQAQAEGGAVFRTETDRNGRYRLGLQPGQYRITAARPGWTTAETNLRLNAGEDRSGVDFALETNFASLSGTIRSSGGAPIENVFLTLIDSVNNRSVQQTTDRDGGYLIENIIPGAYHLIATHPRFARNSLNVGVLLGQQQRRGADMQLLPLGAMFQGRIMSGNEPIAGATAVITLQNGEQRSTLSDNNGRYSQANLAAGRYALRPGRIGFSGYVRENIQLAAAETLTVDLTMVRNDGRITGFVRDLDNIGLRNAVVTAIDSLGNFASANSDISGAFRLENLYPLTRYKVSARLAGYTAEQDTLRGIASGGQADFRMRPNELQLSGRVVNQIGREMPSTELSATSVSDGSVYRTTANLQGNFTFVGLGANTRYRILTARNEEGWTNADTIVELGQNHLDIGSRIRIIQRIAAITGSVGHPDVMIQARNLVTGRLSTAYSSQNGTYRLMRLRGGDAGHFVVRVSKPGFIARGADSIIVQDIGLDEERRNVNFTLDPVLISISGRVVDTSGLALPGCPALAWSNAGEFRTTADSAGSFLLSGLYPNIHYVVATQLPVEGYDNGSFEVDAALINIENRILIVARHNATVAGVVKSAAGDSLRNVNVVLDGVRTAVTDQYGKFQFRYVGGGDHILSFSRAGYERLESSVNTGIGDRVEPYSADYVMTRLERAIYGRVYSATNSRLLRNAIIKCSNERGDTLIDTVANDGLYIFNQLDPERTYKLDVSRKGYITWTRGNISVRDTLQRVDITMSQLSNSLVGEFITQDSLPIERASVLLRSFANLTVYDTTDFSGTFVFRVEAGGYILLGEHPRRELGTSYAQNVSFSGQASLITLRMQNTGIMEGRLAVEGGGPPASAGNLWLRHSASGEMVFKWSERDGSFRLRGLRPGLHTLQVDAAGYAMELSPFYVEVAAWETTRVAVQLTRHGKALNGYVLDERAAPVVGARISIQGPTAAELVTNEAGYFSLASPDAGRYSLHIERAGYTAADTTFDLPPGEMLQVEIMLPRLLNAISGRVRSDLGVMLENQLVRLYDNANSRLLDTIRTNRWGEYQFGGLTPRTYRVSPSTAAYRVIPANRIFTLETDSAFIDVDFLFAPIRGTANVQGYVYHQAEAVKNATVYLRNLETGVRLTKTTNDSGKFAFTEVDAPSPYRLRALVENRGEAISDTFILTIDAIVSRNLIFPAGVIRTRLLDANERPIVGRRIWISGVDVPYNAQFFSDVDGRAQTDNWLAPGRYNVVPQALLGFLPPSPVEITLGLNQTREVVWHLGWAFSPPPPFNLDDSARVAVNVPSTISVADAGLFWRDIGSLEFKSKPLHRAGGGMPAAPTRGLRNVGTEGTTGADATVTYFEYIPAQFRSGTVTYYLQITTTDGFLFGGPETAQDITITAIGVLDRLVFSRTQSALPPRLGVPIKMHIIPLDNANNDLTQRMQTEGVYQWWESGTGLGLLVVDSQDSTTATYTPEEVGPTRIGVTVSQTIGHNVIAIRDTTSFAWTNSLIPLRELNLTGSVQEIVIAGDSVKFTVTAIDTGGSLMAILPTWQSMPSILGSFRSVPYSMETWYRTFPHRIGRARITALESLTGVSAGFNEDSPDHSKRGLSIQGKITGGGADSITFEDGEGFAVTIPPGAYRQGRVAKISIVKSALPPVMRLSTKYETASQGYELNADVEPEVGPRFRFQLPIPPGIFVPKPQVGIWDEARLEWILDTTAVFSADSAAVLVDLNQLIGLYVILNSSQELGIHHLAFRPNPFSPSASNGMSVEFILSSNAAETPLVSVKIYNIVGELIRSLLENRPLAKGEYKRGSGQEIIWDGLTNDHRMARNGRYIVVVTAEDPSGEAKQVGAAALVK